jgi:hypothetical protein
MARYATGKYSQRISDRSGAAFPYKEMVKEWNGSIVHVSEFEAKHPQLIQTKKQLADPEAIQMAKGQIADTTVYPPTDGTSINTFLSTGMQPLTKNKDTKMSVAAGTVTVVIS